MLARPATSALDRDAGTLGSAATEYPPALPGPRAERLFVRLSVYREPVDRNALLFQIGQHDFAGTRTAGRPGPAPPYQEPADLDELLTACRAAGLITVTGSGSGPVQAGDSALFFVDRQAAAELHQVMADTGRLPELADSHRRAAQYWQWHGAAWPQGRHSDIHDLLEARQHLLDAGDTARAHALTESVCGQLHAWGDFGREAELIGQTMGMLPSASAGRAAWLHELAAIAQVQGDHALAGRYYQEAAEMFTAAGDVAGAARSHHGLGVLAQAHGDYPEAERHYEQAGRRAGPAVPGRAHASPPPERTGSSAGSAGPFGTRAQKPSAAPSQPRVFRWWLPGAAALAAVLAAAVLALASLAGPAPGRPAGPPGAAARLAVATARGRAAGWIAQQVSHSAVVACDPAMCAGLQARGIPAGNLLALGPGGAADPLGSNIIVATAAVRSEFGGRLAGVYAPLVVASFGTGSAAIQIRAVAAQGSAAYLRQLRSDLLGRRRAGALLAGNKQLTLTPAARQELTAGLVDARLLSVIAAMADSGPIVIIAFGPAGPGAATAVPLRSADIATGPGHGPGASSLSSLLAFLQAQQPPFRPASAAISRGAGGQAVLRVEFSAPSPLGLLTPAGAAPEASASP